MGTHIEMSSTPGEVFESGLGYHPNEVALALRAAHYRKPLSARLLPAPGLVAGDTVSFDNPRLTDAMVRSIQSIEFGIVGYMSTHSKILLLLISPLLPATCYLLSQWHRCSRRAYIGPLLSVRSLRQAVPLTFRVMLLPIVRCQLAALIPVLTQCIWVTDIP
jgi:hypothetical protein